VVQGHPQHDKGGCKPLSAHWLIIIKGKFDFLKSKKKEEIFLKNFGQM